MPKVNTFTNQAVLNDALKMVKWKSDLALKIFTKYPKNPDADFDARNLTPLAAMIIDAYDFPENEREART